MRDLLIISLHMKIMPAQVREISVQHVHETTYELQPPSSSTSILSLVTTPPGSNSNRAFLLGIGSILSP